ELVARRIKELRTRDIVLETQGLGRRFEGAKGPIDALSNIDIEVRKREFVSVIGPSGCGKSTLIRIVRGWTIRARVRSASTVAPWMGRAPIAVWCFKDTHCSLGSP